MLVVERSYDGRLNTSLQVTSPGRDGLSWSVVNSMTYDRPGNVELFISALLPGDDNHDDVYSIVRISLYTYTVMGHCMLWSLSRSML
jgi:hypothetical protein